MFELEGGAVTHTVRYTISADGGVTVANDFAPRAGTKLPDLPRIGMRLAVPGAFDRVQWFGRGPQENYRDRNTAAFVGLYESAAGDEDIPYVAPQEYGNRTETRWVAVRDKAGAGLLIAGQPLVEFSAHPYWPEDLTLDSRGAKHPADIIRRDFICLTLDLAQMGVGGDDSWGAPVHPQYMVPAKPYAYSFRFQPLAAGDDPAGLARLMR